MADPSLVVRIEGQDTLSGELKKAESGVIRFVGAVSSALTALGAIGFPVVSAANFQKELLNAAKTTGYTREQISGLQEGLQDLSKQSNITAVDFAKIATLGGQLGIGADGNVAALVDFTEQIGYAVTALAVPVELAVESLGKLINIFNIPASQYKGLVSALTEVGNASTATSQQLFDVVRRIGNLGGSIDFPAAAALSGAMIDLGLTAETAGTTITKIFADMKTSSEEFAAVALKGNVKAGQATDSLRFSTKEWVDLVQTDGLGALKAYVTGLNNLDVTQAARVKASLTGEGRLFEAVTKLQEQAKRQARIEEQAAASGEVVRQAKAGIVTLTKEQLAIEEQRFRNLTRAAESANVIDKLLTKGRQGFEVGDSGLKAQQAIMAGLIAQFERFKNNVTALGNSIGNSLLPPLTGILRELSDSINSSVASGQLTQAADDVVAAIRYIRDSLADLRRAMGDLQSTGFDWGALLRISALLLGVAVIKGAASIFRILATSVTTGSGPLAGLTNLLFGTVVASEKASQASAGNAAATTKAGAAAARTGGLFAAMATGINKASAAYLASTARFTQLQRSAIAAQTGPSRAPALAAATAAAYAGVNASLRSIPALQAEIIKKEAQMVAALAAGNNRAASSYLTRQTKLERILALVQANTAAQDRYNAAMARAARVQTLATTGLQNAPRKLLVDLTPAPILKTGALLTSAARIGAEAATALASAFARASAALPAPVLKAAGLIASAAVAGKEAAVAMTTSFATAGAAGMTTAMVVVSGALRRAAAAMALTVALTFSGTLTAKAGGLLARLATLVAGVGGLLASGLGAGILKVTGLTTQWAVATTTLGKSWIVARAGLSLLTRGVGLLFGLLSRFIGVVFFAWMIKELLVMVGWWDKVLVLVQRFGKYVGLWDDTDMPDWVRSTEQVTANTQAVEANQAALKAAKDEAAKFNDDVVTDLTVLGNKVLAMKDLTYNPVDPNAAEENASRFVRSWLTGFSKVSEAAQKLAETNAKIQEAKGVVVDVQVRLKEATSEKGVDLNSASIKALVREYENAQGVLRNLENQATSLNRIIEETGGRGNDPFAGLNASAKNLIEAMFSAEEAKAILLSNNGNAPLLTQFTQAAINAAAATAQLAAAQKTLSENPDARLDQGAGQKAQEDIDAATENVKKYKKEQEQLRAAIVATARSAPAMANALDAIVSSADTAAIKGFNDQAVAIGANAKAAFSGVTLPKLNADSLLSAAAAVAIKTRMRDTFTAMSTSAKDMAEKAKNYVSQALGEIASRAKDLETLLARMGAAATSNQTKAKNQRADKVDDTALRQTIRNLQTQENVEKAYLSRKYTASRALLAEQEAGGVRVSNQIQNQYAMEQQETFELEERYKALYDAENERLSLKRAQRGVKDELANIDALVKSTEYYKKRVQEANAVLNDPTANNQKQVAAAEQRAAALDKLKSTYGLLEAAGERLANTEPIGGTLAVTPAQLAKIEQTLTAVSTGIGAVTVDAAGKIEGVYNTLASGLGNQAQAAGKELAVAQAAFTQFAGLQTSVGQTLDQVSAKYGALIAQNTSFLSGVEQLQTLLRGGVVDTKEIDATAKRITDAIVGAGDKGTIRLNADTQGLASTIATELRNIKGLTVGVGLDGAALTKVGEEFKAVKAEVTPVVDGAGVAEARKILAASMGQTPATVIPVVDDGGMAAARAMVAAKLAEQGVKVEVVPVVSPTAAAAVASAGGLKLSATVIPTGGAAAVEKDIGTVKLKGQLDVTKITGLNGTIKFTDGTQRNARGGLIGSVASLGAGIAKFATGGGVKGPGDGTSDSILSWLSNGEYVIDALTTSRFGSGFFQMLQDAARGGSSLRVLQGLNMPKFATGGPVSQAASNPFAGIANDFKSSSTEKVTSRDTIDVNINSGGRRATIQAGREQANNLVGILRTFEKG